LSSSLARRRVAVTGGGTAGHILAALEILSAYRREFGCEGLFIGSEAGFESRLAPERGERAELIPSLPWARQSWRGRLLAAVTIGPAFFAARRILVRERTELVIGTGGYASVPVCLAGWTLGLRIVIHEANAVVGLANSLLAHIASLACVDSDETARSFGAIYFGSRRVILTGTPSYAPSAEARTPRSPFRFIVLGGSEGSPWLNRRVPELFAELRGKSIEFTVHHLTGMEAPEATQAAYDRAGVSARVEGWVADMGPVYSGATLAIASPGARTLAELSTAGIPSLLIPLPGIAHDHHSANARLYSGQTGARFVAEEEWDTKELAGWIESLLARPEVLREMGMKMRLRAQPGAAEAIVRESERLFGPEFTARVSPRPSH
jgi:UDP-N-acetylglucosamine--N-acetylmuramyl-(pentapeptide) pyrophosphoryl-undecaprenol N-acetylglucosamine transferase